MITFVQALSKDQAQKYRNGHFPLAKLVSNQYQERVAYIGFECRQTGPSPFRTVQGPLLIETVSDVDPRKYPGVIFEDVATQENGDRIFKFLKRIHDKPEPWAVIVHCMAGVSRSGAVAWWVNARMHPSRSFVARHTKILPNPWIVHLLDNAAKAP